MPPARDLKHDFRTEGFLAGIPVCDAMEVAHYRDCFDELENVEGKEKCATGLLDRHFDQRFIWELAIRSRILECVQTLLGPDVLLLATHFFCKYGPQKKFVAWHQDVTYWNIEPPHALTAWYAIDDSDQENGCMRVIPGSHHDGIREHATSQQDGNLLSINQELFISKHEAQRARDLVLKAGEVSLHDGALIHGSLPNRSTRRRCGLTLRYVNPAVRPVAKNSMGLVWRAVLVCGKDRFGNFELGPNPF